jgi:hypothetical protein
MQKKLDLCLCLVVVVFTTSVVPDQVEIKENMDQIFNNLTPNWLGESNDNLLRNQNILPS